MAKERRCPNCLAPLPIGSGVKFDADNNVICRACNAPIIAATSDAKVTPKTAPEATKPTTGGPFNPGYCANSHQHRKPIGPPPPHDLAYGQHDQVGLPDWVGD